MAKVRDRTGGVREPVMIHRREERAIEKKSPIMLFVTFFVLGSASIIVQSLMVREFLVVFHGNELCLGLILGLWLLSIAGGASLYSIISRRFPASWNHFSIAVALFAAVPYLQLYLIRNARHFLAPGAGSMIPFLPMAGWTVLVVLPYGLLMGALFPMGCSLAASGGKPGGAVSWIYAAESCGALTGGALFSCLLVGKVIPLSMIWGLSMMLCCCAMVVYLMKGESAGPVRVLPALCLVIFCLAPFLSKLEAGLVQARWNALVPGLPLLESRESPYQNLALTKQGEQYSLYGNGEYSLSFPDPYGSRVNAHLMMAEHPAPRKILVIGLVSGGFLGECLKHRPAELHYVLLDPVVMDIMKPCLDEYDRWGFEEGRVRIIYTDGRYLVNSSKEVYDCVLLALPDPSSAMINRFYTKEFFSALSRVVAPRGVVILSLSSSENYMGAVVGNYNASVYGTLRSVFPFVAIAPGDRYLYFASREPGVVSEEPAVLARRLEERRIAETDFSPFLFEAFFEPGRVHYARQAVSRDRVAVNSDLEPVTYYYNLLLWDTISGSRLSPFFQLVKAVTLLRLGAFLLVFFLGRALAVRWKKPSPRSMARFNLQAAVALFGFAAMGLEVMLVFSFQNLYGCIYRMIGLLVASFMAGMTAGALLFSVVSAGRKPRLRYFVILQGILAVFSGLLPLLIAWFSQGLFHLPPAAGQALFMLLMAFAGLFNGLGFPYACRLYPEESPGRAAGVLNGWDHLGAALGGLLCGTFMVPLLGTGPSCSIIGMCAAAAASLWLISSAETSGRDAPPAAAGE